MLVLYVIALLCGVGLGLRLMLGGVLKDVVPGTGESGSAAATRRARARLLTPLAASVLASFGLTGAAMSRGTGWGTATILITSLAVAGASIGDQLRFQQAEVVDGVDGAHGGSCLTPVG